MNGWNQEKYHLMLWTQNNLQAHSLTFHLHCKSGSLFSNVQLSCDDVWKERQTIKVIWLCPRNWWQNSNPIRWATELQASITMELNTVRSTWYSLERLFPPAYVSRKLPLKHCVGDTTFSVRKVNGKVVAKTIVGWLTWIGLFCKLLVFLVSNFSVIHNTKKVVWLNSRHRKNLVNATFILNKFTSVA